jgi:hypothetical protein
MLKRPALKNHGLSPNAQTHDDNNEADANEAAQPQPQPQPQPSSNTILGTDKPEEWGPPVWFTLHNGAAGYPLNPSEPTKVRMKWFIRGFPLMIPCLTCRDHATGMIEISNLDYVVASREALAYFFIEMHNTVNKRLGRPTFSNDTVISDFYPFRHL